MANGHGGKRKGAGRKPGAVTQAKRELAEEAKEFSAEMLATLVSIAKDTEAPHASRVSAASAVLDRGFGKPFQATDVTSNGESIGLPREIIVRAAE